MESKFNVNEKSIEKKIYRSKRFIKYPEMFISNYCTVKVNNDDYLKKDEFTIYSKFKKLPKRLYIYGKKTSYNQENNIYLNYWMPIFLKTVENGELCKEEFAKCTSKAELCIGLTKYFRAVAYKGLNWNRQSIIDFLSCLFDIEIEETKYVQQDLIELMLAS